MLWYKAWQESRWRFLSGLVVLMVLACGIVFEYPATAKLMPLASSIDAGDSFIGRAIKEAIEAQRDFRGFVWWQWVRQNLTLTWTLFAVLLGSGGLLSDGSGRGTLFTLSLPASRRRVPTTPRIVAAAASYSTSPTRHSSPPNGRSWAMRCGGSPSWTSPTPKWSRPWRSGGIERRSPWP